MQIVDFTAAHIEQAAQIAKLNYDEERRAVPALPPADVIPDLTQYAENGLGVAAFENETILGYLCAVGLYCMPEHRGKGVSQNLLSALIREEKANGKTRLGVDYESLNSGKGE